MAIALGSRTGVAGESNKVCVPMCLSLLAMANFYALLISDSVLSWGVVFDFRVIFITENNDV